jgi:hypothetical protein
MYSIQETNMKKYIAPRLLSSIFCAGTLLSGTAQAREVTTDEWQYSAAIYMWAASIGGDSSLELDDQAKQVFARADIDISFDNLIDNLDMAFMGSLEARKQKWLFIADLLYLDISAGNRNKLTLPTQPPLDIKTRTKLGMTGWVLQGAGGYNLVADSKSSFDVLGGVRHFDLGTDLSFDYNGTILNRKIKASSSGNVTDAFVGFKGRYALSPRWDLRYYADMGTGQSDFTWQASAGITWQATNNMDVALTYRHLQWDVGGDAIDNIHFSGALLGTIFHW